MQWKDNWGKPYKMPAWAKEVRQDHVVISIECLRPPQAKKIVSPSLNTVEDICLFIIEQCEEGVFDDPSCDGGSYRGGLKLEEKTDGICSIIIGYHESESRSNCKVSDFPKDATIRDIAEAILRAVPCVEHLQITIVD